MSEEAYADWKRRAGLKVVESRGRFWGEIFPGFYDTMPFLARATAKDLHRPTSLAWGYKAALDDQDAHLANGFMPVFLIPDISEYGEHLFQRRRGRNIRRCLREVSLVHLTDPQILHDQGYELYLSFASRLRVPPLSAAKYHTMVDQWWQSPGCLVLAGLRDGRLLGYQESCAVGTTAYLEKLHVGPEGMSMNLSAAIYREVLELCRRSGMITEVTCGLDRCESPGLSAFKELMGFQIVKVPAYFHVPRAVRACIRRIRPNTYYRFTGQYPQNEARGGAKPV